MFTRMLSWIGDNILMPIIDGIDWVFSSPVPLTLTVIAGLLIGLIAGG